MNKIFSSNYYMGWWDDKYLINLFGILHILLVKTTEISYG